MKKKPATDTPQQRYLVTGCAGFIGSHLTEALLAAGHEVVGVDGFTDYYPRDAKERNIARARREPSFSLVEANLASEPLEPLLAGVAGVFHLAARPGVRGSWGSSFAAYVEDNLLVTQRVFEAAVAKGVRVVFASSSSIYGNAEAYPIREDARPAPISPYGVTKLACEDLSRAYETCSGLDVVALRYFTVYGPRQRPDMAFTRVLTALLEGSAFHLTEGGQQSRDFTFVGDAVAATMLAMDHAPRGAVYNVGGGTEATLLEAVRICEDLAGRSLDIRHEPHVAGDVRRTAADTSSIRAQLGWRPATGLADGLSAELAALLETRAEKGGRRRDRPPRRLTRSQRR